MNKKNKEARQKCYVCAGIDELNQIVAENWHWRDMKAKIHGMKIGRNHLATKPRPK